jgi:Tol biopolymer transport system component
MSVNVSSGAATQIATLPGLPEIQGRPLLVTATNEIFHLDRTFHSILAQSLVDGRSRIVATFEGDQEINSYLPSPDGRKVAYSLAHRYQNGRACLKTSSEPVTTVNQITKPCEIVVMTVASGERKVIATTTGQNADVPSLISWSPDSRFLLFGGGRPLVLDTAKETRTPLLLQSQPLDWDRTASWSPDGTFIVFTDRAQRFEWREWKGVR